MNSKANRGLLAGWLREPVLHFVIIGLVIFALDAWVRAKKQPRIVITAATVETLRDRYLRKTESLPPPDQMERLVDEYIDEEVLFREGRSLELDQDDPIIRRRLASKMAFLLQELDLEAEPTTAELKAYYKKNERLYQPTPFPLMSARVALDLKAEKRRTLLKGKLQELRGRYEIIMETSALGAGSRAPAEPPQTNVPPGNALSDPKSSRLPGGPAGQAILPTPGSMGRTGQASRPAGGGL